MLKNRRVFPLALIPDRKGSRRVFRIGKKGDHCHAYLLLADQATGATANEKRGGCLRRLSPRPRPAPRVEGRRSPAQRFLSCHHQERHRLFSLAFLSYSFFAPK